MGEGRVGVSSLISLVLHTSAGCKAMFSCQDRRTRPRSIAITILVFDPLVARSAKAIGPAFIPT